MFGNEVTHDIYGNSLKKEIKRQPVGRSQKNLVKITQKGRCKDCHKVLVVEEYHHIKHVAHNGKSVTGNLVALCPECHRKRHTKEKALELDKKRTKKKMSSTDQSIESKLNKILRGS
jgi:5-methylcytosine-specific restriction endonuclease McrA